MRRVPALLFAIAAILACAGSVHAAPADTPPLRSLARARAVPPAGGAPLVAILCYHDISDDPSGAGYTVSPAEFRRHLRILREAGWSFLSLSELLARKDRAGGIPPKTIVVTFDDAYRSFLEKALPILKEEGVKATVAVVSSFIDSPPPDVPEMMTWEQLKAAEGSGFAEVASHSHDLHRFEVSNPYNDTAPSVTTRRYRNAEKRYEDRDEYRGRIRADLRKSKAVLSEKLGRDVSVLAWPYGEYNEMARELAGKEGFAVTLGVEGGDVRPDDFRRGHLPRVMVRRGTDFGSRSMAWLYPIRAPVRAAQADLDSVYHADPEIFRARVDRLVGKIRAAGANTVFLHALSDPAGDGYYREAYFMNHQLPVRADVWSMVAHKFRHAGIRVWIRAPVMNLSWEWERHPEWRIPFRRKRGGAATEPWYFRISPDLPGPRRAAADFYADIAVYLPVEGVLFDDDAYLLAGERLRQGRPASPAAKSAAIRTLIEEAKAAVLAWRPNCAFGRNLYAPAAERDGVHPNFSQDLSQFLSDYDLTVVMAYARMEGHAKDAAKWERKLAARVEGKARAYALRDGGLPPVMLKFQAYDWEKEEWVPPGEIAAGIRAAAEANVHHVGVYPVLPEEGDLPEGILKGIPIPGSERYAEP
jgi:biofilm PGA synthesis lipoprotein PgaB